MAKAMITIHDLETDQTTVREMTADELLQKEAVTKQIQNEQEKTAKAETDKTALLAKLGISSDEAKLLLS